MSSSFSSFRRLCARSRNSSSDSPHDAWNSSTETAKVWSSGKLRTSPTKIAPPRQSHAYGSLHNFCQILDTREIHSNRVDNNRVK